MGMCAMCTGDLTVDTVLRWSMLVISLLTCPHFRSGCLFQGLKTTDDAGCFASVTLAGPVNNLSSLAC
jgi:hypothetical protein